MDTKKYERHAKKIIDVFSDGSVTGADLMYIAFYTVINAYPADPVLDRLVEYVNHVQIERERIKENHSYVQDTIF